MHVQEKIKPLLYMTKTSIWNSVNKKSKSSVGQDQYGRVGLVTVEQCERHARAEINKILTIAAGMCEHQAEEWDSDNQVTDKNYAKKCADLVRSLINTINQE